jgi:hypothetical protein
VLYADLVASMREGVLYETLPFLVRFLLISLGPQATMDMISAFRANVAPKPFGADEARHFVSYVRAQAPVVPHLAEVLDFEDALNAVGGTLEERVVTFECDPAALLTALVERNAPGAPTPERFHVDVLTNGIKIR